MTSLTKQEIEKNFGASKSEVFEYIKKHRMPLNNSSRKIARRRLRNSAIRHALGKEVSFTSPAEPWQIIYGTVRTGGVITFLHSTDNNGKMHVVITLAGHQIDGITKVFFDDEEIVLSGIPGTSTQGVRPDGTINTAWAGKVYVDLNYGTTGQAALTSLITNSGGVWTSNCKQSGCAHVYLQLTWDATLFPDGLPDITFEIRGKPVYDPRTTLTTYSHNTALCIADYLMDTRIGLGVPLASIDDTLYKAAANTCEQPITLNGGGTEYRYMCNGAVSSEDSPQDIMESILSSMAGFIVYVGGVWKIYAGEYRAPAINLDENDIISSIEVAAKIPRRDNFNAVRGTHINPNRNWEEADFPAFISATYLAEDNNQRVWEDIELPFTHSAAACQRIAKLLLEKQRQGLIVALTATLKAYQLEAGNGVSITNTRLGWSVKVFEVEDSQLVITEGEGGAPVLAVALLLRETASNSYDWAAGADTIGDPAANTNLPNPSIVSAPVGLTLTSGTADLYLRLDGTVFSRIHARWSAITDNFVIQGGHIQVQVKKSADSSWLSVGLLSGDAIETYILDVQDGYNYDVRIRAQNAIGALSAYTTSSNHTVIGKTELPTKVTVFSAVAVDNGILLTWTKITDLDLSKYEIRYGGATWEDATFVAQILGSGDSYMFQYGLVGSVTMRIKSLDTSGNYAAIDATAVVSISGPSAVINFGANTVGNTVLLDWEDPAPSTLSVIEYDVYKGDVFASALKIGTVFGTFHTYVEQLGGTFTYWVVAIDWGGNRSTEVSALATVTPSTDFFLVDSVDPVPDVTSSMNCTFDGSTIFLPVNTHVSQIPLVMLGNILLEDWDTWWTSYGWTTWQDAIDSGYPMYLQPSSIEGWVEMKVDFGVIFGSSFIDWSWVETQYGTSTATIIPTLSISEDDVSYTDYAGATQVFAENFRYVKLRLDFNTTDGYALSALTEMSVDIQLFREEETGIAAVLAADSGGTVVTFTKDFLDVEDIQLTPEGTTAQFAVSNFTDIPDPVSFQILLFNDSGTRINGNVRYRVRGAVNP